MANDSVYNLVDRAAINATDRLGVWHTSGATRAQYLEVGFLGLAVSDLAAANANQTGVVGTLQHWDLSSLSQNRDWTLPATAAVGERCGIYIDTGDATDEVEIKCPASDTIDGVDHSANEKTRLFITGELMIFRCIVANTAWITEVDGRIPCFTHMYEGTGTTLTSSSYTRLSLDTIDASENIGDIGDTGNNRVNIRRDGVYQITGASQHGSAADTNNCRYRIDDASAAGNILAYGSPNYISTTGTNGAIVATQLRCLADSELHAFFFTNTSGNPTASTGKAINYFQVSELFRSQ